MHEKPLRIEEKTEVLGMVGHHLDRTIQTIVLQENLDEEATYLQEPTAKISSL